MGWGSSHAGKASCSTMWWLPLIDCWEAVSHAIFDSLDLISNDPTFSWFLIVMHASLAYHILSFCAPSSSMQQLVSLSILHLKQPEFHPGVASTSSWSAHLIPGCSNLVQNEASAMIELFSRTCSNADFWSAGLRFKLRRWLRKSIKVSKWRWVRSEHVGCRRSKYLPRYAIW